MQIISHLTPTNLVEEYNRFLADQTYNPQFTYRQNIATDQLHAWGLPKDRLAEFAREMIIHINKVDPWKPKTEIVTQASIREAIDQFNHAYRLKEPLKVVFTDQMVTQCRVSPDKIEFRLPLIYSPLEFQGVYRHELETHYLRIHNQQLQNWPDYTAADDHFRRTEEGLAGLHTNLFSGRYMRKTFRTYLTTWLAQRYSFTETYAQLRALGISERMSWLHTLRAKRGLTDTSQPGGPTKDICYLEGCLQIWHWLQDESHNPYHLYLGRISLEEIDKYAPTAETKQLLYPRFFDDLAKYRQGINDIGVKNQFHQVIEEVSHV